MTRVENILVEIGFWMLVALCLTWDLFWLGIGLNWFDL